MKQDHGRKGVRNYSFPNIKIDGKFETYHDPDKHPFDNVGFSPSYMLLSFHASCFPTLYAKNHMLDENWQRSRFPDSEKKIVKQ